MSSIQKLQILLQTVEAEINKKTKVSKTSARKQLLNISKETQILRKQLLNERKNQPVREKKNIATAPTPAAPPLPSPKKKTRRKRVIDELPTEPPKLIRT